MISIFLSVYSGHIYISSQTSVWKLTPRSLNFQIKQLLESKEFELALKLAVSLNNKYVLQICVINKDPKTYRSLNNIGIRVKKTYITRQKTKMVQKLVKNFALHNPCRCKYMTLQSSAH